jgi:hypothetical protein
MLVVLQVFNQDRILVGWIKKIILRKKKVFFLLTAKMCRRLKMRYFQSQNIPGEVLLKNVDVIKSFRPLIPRGNEGSYVFFLCGKLVDDFAFSS